MRARLVLSYNTPQTAQEITSIKKRGSRRKITTETKITSNTIDIFVELDNGGRKFAKLISHGNYDFWDHDPGGLMLKAHLRYSQEETLDLTTKALRLTREFHILPGNYTISCFQYRLSPTEQDVEDLLKVACEKIKEKLAILGNVTLQTESEIKDEPMKEIEIEEPKKGKNLRNIFRLRR